MALVLCIGADLALLETRRWILERAGHTVVPAIDQDTIISACKQRTFDVAIIGQSVSPGSKKSIASIIRQHCPSARILELHAAFESKTVENADSRLEVPVDVPQELAERVAQLVLPKQREQITA